MVYSIEIKLKKNNEPLRRIPLDLEDAFGVSTYVLVFPGHSIGSHDIRKPIMRNDILLLLPRVFFFFHIC